MAAAVLLLSALAALAGAAPAQQVPERAGAPATLTVASPRGERRVAVRTARGYPAVRLAELAAVLSVEAGLPQGGVAAVRIGGERFDLVLDAPYFRFDDAVYPLAGAPYLAGESLFVPLQLAVEYLPRLLEGRFRYDAARGRLEELAAAAETRRPPAPSARPAEHAGPRIVAIDAGHGGPDVGMQGPIGGPFFLREKDITLAVARAVADELSRHGVRAVLTRTRDTLIALADRGRIAGAAGADLFVSIHVNAANPRWGDARGARGYETYFLAEARSEDARRVARMENESVRFETGAGRPQGGALGFILNDLAQNEHLRESSRLAELIEASLDRTHPAEGRGVKQAGFAVLATSYMPAVLVEVGFGSNRDEARFLTSADGQRRVARAVAEGIQRYLAEYERRVAVPSAEGR